MDKPVDPRASPGNLLGVVIRSVGERTERLCRDFLLAQGVPAGNVAVIKMTPFAAALKASYEAGIALAKPWTLCLDADVLLAPGSIGRLLGLARRKHPSLFEMQCLVLDKFLGGPREAGNHVYRTSLLSQALECIPAESSVIRPERQTVDVMKARGFTWERIDLVIGLHGFEQYYADVFRTCFVHARKHQDLAEIFLSYWPEQRAMDYDYHVAIKGFIAGMEFRGDVAIDSEKDIYRNGFAGLRISEKPDLEPGSMSPSDISRVLDDWMPPPAYRKYFPEVNGIPRLGRQFAQRWREMGPLRFPVFMLGRALEKAGGWIRRRVESP